MPRHIGQVKRKLLRFEALESRQLLSGVVNIITNPTLFTPRPAFPLAGPMPPNLAGDVVLVGNTDANQISMRSTGVAFQYEFTGLDTTQLLVNGSPMGSPVTVGGINGDIDVRLGGNEDTFVFLPQSATADSVALGDVLIWSVGGDTVEIGAFDPITGLSVGKTGVAFSGELAIAGVGAASTTELRISNSSVTGPTIVRNPAGNIDAKVVDSIFNGAPVPGPTVPLAIIPGPGGGPEGGAFSIGNLAGQDIIDILGTTTFGTGGIAPGPALTIYNYGGGSQITFGAEAADRIAAIDVFGDLVMRSRGNPLGILDYLSMDNVTVTEAMVIDHDGGPGGSTVTITDSDFGTNLLDPVADNAFFASSGNGTGSFTMSDSTAPWGLFVTHVQQTVPGPPTDTGSSFTQIEGSLVNGVLTSQVGTRALGPIPTLPAWLPAFFPGINGALLNAGYTPGDGLLVQGGLGQDTVNVIGTAVGGASRFELWQGANNLTMRTDDSTDPAITVPSLFYNTRTVLAFGLGTGVDNVELRDIMIPIQVNMQFGFGRDILSLKEQTMLPLFGAPVVVLNGGADINDLDIDPTVVPNPLLGLIGIWL
jgi:hypothetical protein